MKHFHKVSKVINKITFHIYVNPMVTKCACCGGNMLPERDIGNSVIYKCAECGLSDTRLRVKAEEEG
jgi:Zn finger protein HypA/HybF involved in hydrogenase expression